MENATCPKCHEQYLEREGQDCAGCEQAFCPKCAADFETCERCGRVFCIDCTSSYLQIPSAVSICNDCYGEYVEDTDFLFE
jgi:hypothetical protein